ncbi:MAG: M48 family metalloprotease [Thermoanaerobaculia bacterium]|nr:M48 family metalloprotease [Thermoanaerobaculia bacterium]
MPCVGFVRPVALAASLLALAAPLAAAEPNVDLFEKSLQAAAEAIKVYGAWDAPDELARVAEIGYRVAQETGFRDFPISFYLIDLPEPNAFALPGGQIFVTRGMLSIGLGDDELAALLGHEIAHVVHRHGLRIERRATLLNILTQVALVGAMVTAADRDPSGDSRLPYPYNLDRGGSESADMITGTYATGMILSELLLRSYSREFEDESDLDGQRWAAAAGFAPDGTETLMAMLGSRLPDSKEYGYWRTHPFFDQRVAVAAIRSRSVEIGAAKPAEEFRSWSQNRILDFGSRIGKEPPTQGGRPERDAANAERVEKRISFGEMIESAALTAWPKGVEAERLRLERIHRERERLLARVPLSRDYGTLLAAYDRQLAEVEALDAQSALLPTLRDERATLAGQAAELLPQAREVWRGGVYETGFLETFVSNWPDDPELPRVALALGEAYSRTGRQADAVRMFLRAEQSDGEAASSARRGLRTLAPSLDQLTALAELAAQQQDADLAAAAAARLAAVAPTYSRIELGAAYLERYPQGEHAAVVTERLNLLADNLYGEVVLYQGIGDHLKAIERIQKILTYAPTSPAAQKLLERVVLPS